MKTNLKNINQIENKLLIKNYLQGTTEGILGSVLSFSKKIQYNISYDYFSFILYVDHRTGRIERYAINTTQPTENINTINDTSDVYFFNNDKYKIFHEDEHRLDNIEKIGLYNLNNGKLTSKFYNLFMVELIRDWIFIESSYNNPENSYSNPNMVTIRKLTSPIKAKEYENNKLITPALGTGIINENDGNLIHKNRKHKLLDYTPFNAKRFINIPEEIKKTIFIPKQFKFKHHNILYENMGINLISINRNELPQLIKDLVRSINIKNIENSHDLSRRIKTFNFNIVKRLQKLENKK